MSDRDPRKQVGPEDLPENVRSLVPGAHAGDRQQRADESGCHGDGEGGSKLSAAALLVELALERYRFGCTPEGEAFGVPKTSGHVVRMLRGSRTSLRAELARLYRQKTSRVAPQQALADAMLTLEGEAQDSEPEPVHLRIAEAGGALWLDLGDADETVIRVDSQGWQPTASAPVLFRRTALTAAMPAPIAGTMDELWTLLNVMIEDRPLVLGWLVAALAAPDIPHPIAALFGEQGTGKSTASRLLTELVDPSTVPLRKPPRDMDSWVTAASGSWVVGIDNLSAVQDWLSDTLCRAVTGDGDVRRQLYTDSGLSVFAFRRVLLLNGIDLGGLRGDLSERLLTIHLEPISDQNRRTEHALTHAWQEAKPRLLGALLAEIAATLATIPYVRLESSPRMADFATILAALDTIHGTHGLARYAQQANDLAADSLASDPFIDAMTTIDEPFEGTSAALLATVPTPDGRPPRGWPASARAVTSILRRNAPALRKQGWTVEDSLDNRGKTAIWHLRKPVPDQPEKAREDVCQSAMSAPRRDSRQTDRNTGHLRSTPPTESTCVVCHARMIISEPGQTAHPGCMPDDDQPAAVPAEVDRSNAVGDGRPS